MQTQQTNQTQRAKSRLGRGISVFLLLLVLGVCFAIYWHQSGKIQFDGTVQDSLSTVTAQGTGTVTRLEVKVGELVRRGQVLVRLDEETRRQALLEAQEKLAQLERLVPPEYLRVPVPGEPGVEQSLTARLEDQRAEEDAARIRLEDASDNEAKARILASRVASMAARHEATPEQRAAAEDGLAAASREKEEAKRAFEALSLRRAGTGQDIRRMRDAQTAIGAGVVPVETRLSMYTQQRERVVHAVRALEQADIRAPEDGMVAQLLVAPGQSVAPGLPCLLLRPAGAEAVITAELPRDISRNLKEGQPCLIHIREVEGGAREGYVLFIRPMLSPEAENDGSAAKTAFEVVTVRLLPSGDEALEQQSMLRGGETASVTVSLRESSHSAWLNRHATSGADPGYAQSSRQASGTAGQVDSAAPPLPAQVTVQTPFGAEAPTDSAPSSGALPTVPNTLGGVPSAKGHTPPVLPPMQAPYPLQGSPSPDPANNPSLVTPQILDNAATAPR